MLLGPYGLEFATITTGDMTGPVLVGLGPADNSIDVPVDANFVVSFDEPVQVNPGPVAINIFRLDNNTIFTSAFTNSGDVTVDGNSVTINPPVDLEPGVEYGINVPPSAIEDLSGNDIGEILQEDSVIYDGSYDSNHSQVVSLFPSDGATDVPLDTPIIVTIRPGYRTGPEVSFLSTDTNFFSFVLDPNLGTAVIQDNTVTFTPGDAALDLDPNSLTAISIPASAFQDAGKAIRLKGSQLDSLNRSPPDAAPPVGSLSPVNGTVDVLPESNLPVWSLTKKWSLSREP